MRSFLVVLAIVTIFSAFPSEKVAVAQVSSSATGATVEQRLSALEQWAKAQDRSRAASPNYVNALLSGAVGDGTHDDGPALQKAIDSLHAAGGGTLFLPAGKYRVTGSGLKLLNNVTLQGVDTYATRVLFDQSIYKEYLINLHNVVGEYAPAGQRINDLRIITTGGGAVREDSTPWTKDNHIRGWHQGGMRNVTIEGGARGAYMIDLPSYSQKCFLENVLAINYLGVFLRINGNCNVMRNVGPDGWPVATFRNVDKLPMMRIDGDSNLLEDTVIEAFAGFPALQISGYRHRVNNIWAEAEGELPDGDWILLNDAHQIMFDSLQVLVEDKYKLKLVNSDAIMLALEPKHFEHSLQLDDRSSLTVIVPARAMKPGLHVVADPNSPK